MAQALERLRGAAMYYEFGREDPVMENDDVLPIWRDWRGAVAADPRSTAPHRPVARTCTSGWAPGYTREAHAALPAALVAYHERPHARARGAALASAHLLA